MAHFDTGRSHALNNGTHGKAAASDRHNAASAVYSLGGPEQCPVLWSGKKQVTRTNTTVKQHKTGMHLDLRSPNLVSAGMLKTLKNSTSSGGPAVKQVHHL